MPYHPSADQIISLYDRHASIWNDLRSDHFVDRKWIERFRSLLPPTAIVLDLGCGSGQPVARQLMFTSGPAHGEALGELQGETLYHASLDPEEYTARLNDHGFGVLEHIVEDAECGGQTVWLARRLLR